MSNKYTQAPGRGLMSNTAYELRMDYMNSLVDGIEKDLISETIGIDQIQNNIESFIGTIEIPLGLIGPLLFVDEKKETFAHTAIATTEGALAASMNRGAKAISECGGFRGHIVHQKMLRTPMFTFESMSHAMEFDHWIKQNFNAIKEITQKYSNYADLLEIRSVIVGKIVHLKFIYTTSDASGQNMTTSCTWHSCLWIEINFQEQSTVEILHFVIDGNGASDKKVSFYSIQNGRGIHVISECFLTNEIIEKTLRTTASDMFRSYNHSMAISRLDGMIGYNINVANAIAGIFGSTGQDLACIHESSTGILQMEETPEGLYLSLSLPNLVVGTVGGGTHLPVASRILELMECKGAGKVNRFAKLIAGFTLSLEISTLAAIVSGQFARAHQKLGRNKPVKWLLKSEINQDFISHGMKYVNSEIESFSLTSKANLENGILMDLTSRVSKKLIGFIELEVVCADRTVLPILIKSKALGIEVLDGLRFMASNLNSTLADTLFEFRDSLEYADCHKKEIEVYEALRKIEYADTPTFYGSMVDEKREIHLFFMERLVADNMRLFNSENVPEEWSNAHKKSVIESIHQVHRSFAQGKNSEMIPSVKKFEPAKAWRLFSEFNNINRADYAYLDLDGCFLYLNEVLEGWKLSSPVKSGALTLVHNDFNPRNLSIRKDLGICIYDWELATINLPQRDIFEFLAFTLESDFSQDEFQQLVELHYNLVMDFNDSSYTFQNYLIDFKLAGDEFLLTRVSYYLTGNSLLSYPFIQRVFGVSHKMLSQLAEMR